MFVTKTKWNEKKWNEMKPTEPPTSPPQGLNPGLQLSPSDFFSSYLLHISQQSCQQQSSNSSFTQKEKINLNSLQI